MVGTRNVVPTLARIDYAEWQRAQPDVHLLSLPEAGAHAGLVVNAALGAAALGVLGAVVLVRCAAASSIPS